MKKIGIITLFHQNYNWGGVLQAYALKKTIEKNFEDVSVDILNYKSNYNPIYPTLLDQMKQYSLKEVIFKTIEKVFKNKKNVTNQVLKKRIELFDKFMMENLTNTTVYDDNKLENLAKEYSYLICGSDQVWNPNVARKGFFLDDINDECVKIAYAASIARNDLSEHERNIMLPMIEKIDYVSVREKTAKKVLDKYIKSNKKIYETLDPTLLMPRNEWLKILPKNNKNDEKYALAFFFSDSLKYRNEILKICESKGLKLKFIPFAKQTLLKNDNKGKCERIYDVGPYEFLQLVSEAEYVFTDSFHGAVFSIIFQKEFIVFERDKNTKVSKNSRLYDLLDKFEVQDRLVKDMNMLNKTLNKECDFSKIEKILNNQRENSLKYLKNAIDFDKKKNNYIEILNKKNCCGCMACFNKCPQKAIVMLEDEEGFKYPVIDKKKCIECGICKNVCPILKKSSRNNYIKAFACMNKNDDIRMKSSSGGMFTLIAEKIISQGGKVFGASFNDNFDVEHICIENKNDLFKLRSSKYVQSNINTSYQEAKDFLDGGIKVLFTGTPCQIEGLYSFLGKDYDNLYTQDIICHGVPSKKVWNKYLEYKKEKIGQNPVEINFRNKKNNGWKKYQISFLYKNKEIYYNHNSDLYMRAFLSDVALRESCYDCKFKKINRMSDITLGDFWGIDNILPEMNDKKGTSLIMLNSEKGRKIFDEIKKDTIYKEVNFEEAIKYNPSFNNSSNKNNNRNEFFKDLNKLEFKKLIKKYGKNTTFFYKAMRKIKSILNKILK